MKMVGYLSLGYPTLERSLEMADVYIEGGCNAVEISIPSPNPCYEKETIKTWMQEAYAAEADYEVYFNAIEGIKKRHPDREVYTMVYQEVFDMITPQRYADFCVQAGVDCVISANLTKESIDALDEKAVSRCSFGSFILDPKRLNNCLKPGDSSICRQSRSPGRRPCPDMRH